MSGTKSRGGRREASRDKAQLTRDDWLDAAAGAIVEGGFDNVRVLVLARKLGVTRGSFYWHFRDHQDLIVSFLKRWRDRRFQEFKYWKLSEDDPVKELRKKLHTLLSETAKNARRLRIELAVRDFARRDAYAAEVVAEVDQARIAENVVLLEQLPTDPRVSRDLALILYAITIGAQVVLTGPTGDEPTIQRVEGLIADTVARWQQIDLE
ncbi:TetR family transcriptional regulator [Alkalilimnicola ehrlichii]|uniref:TetR family transcriptional regulator n=1 Tax=Alkalilimnicola ehrlichii TaxID=351052 RepID=A0A3E0WVS8_9GAMM|nr:TetR/AcrR family transcriptional regulator [Alkalilimnicola ehrlichii]RFA29194.1 TetR family transcriptional regulator [Alkalilimnicola ehrlichii]RFA36105.1 TetR family transcriptional regulator [Alkalilimnicola ehrlichii]